MATLNVLVKPRPPSSPDRAKAMQEMFSAFEDDLTQALIPFVDKTYRTLATRENRAMAVR